MSPWTQSFIQVISEARMFARAWDDANHFQGFMPITYLRSRMRLAHQRSRLEMALAQYVVERERACK